MAFLDLDEQPAPLHDVIDSHASIQHHLYRVFGICGREKQIEVLYRLMVEKKDTILLAKTGFGKSIVFQAPSMLGCDRGVAIVLLPLLALQFEQEQKLKSIGGRPFVLNGDTNSKANREMIRHGQYTHILTSPEIAVTEEFNREVLRDSGFSSRIVLLAVDELHLVEHWGREFRPDYMNIAVIRSRMPANVPMLGVTATMNPRLLGEITASAGFNSDVEVIRTPLDRPEIFIQVRPMLHAATSMRDLAFLVEEHSQGALDYENIPKTIIFMESILQVQKACHLLRSWISMLDYPASASPWVQPFFSAMAQHDKDRIAEAFSRPSSDCKTVRILICTDAYGLGIDNPDVVRVVQYGTPERIEVLYQRAGRAMRSAAQQAFFLMLFKPALVGSKIKATDATSSQSERKRIQRRADLSPCLYSLINPTKCLRSIILEFFHAVDAKPASRDTSELCCSFCNPSEGLNIRPNLIETTTSAGSHAKAIEDDLKGWRKAKAGIDLPSRFKQHESALLLDKSIALIARHSPSINRVKELRGFVGFGWSGYRKYGDELLTVVRSSVAKVLEETKRKEEELSQKYREEAGRRIQERKQDSQEYFGRLQRHSQNTEASSQMSQDIITNALKCLENTRRDKENFNSDLSQSKLNKASDGLVQNSEKRKPLEVLQDTNRVHQQSKRAKRDKDKQPLIPLITSRAGRVSKPSAKKLA